MPERSGTDLICNLSEVSKICKTISNHIQNAAASAYILYNTYATKNRAELLRYATILNLIAFEETGKLFMVWQEAANAERQKQSELRVVGFYHHRNKGEKAGQLFIQMVETILNHISDSFDSIKKEENTFLELLSNEIVKNVFSEMLKDYRDHLTLVGDNFKEIREQFMHTDPQNDYPHTNDNMEILFIATDSFLFDTIAHFAALYLASGESFSLATKALFDIKEDNKSSEVERFVELLNRVDVTL